MAALVPFFDRDATFGSVANTMRQMMSVADDIYKTLDEPSRGFLRESQAMANTAVDVKETPKTYEFVADLPGLGRDEVKVQVENGNILVISGERSREKKDEGDRYHRVERSTGKFMRRFTLPQDAQLDKIEAACSDGVLKVTVPKMAPKEPEKPKVIDVQIS